MQELIPLFPLGTVLFPGLVLPLNIFEPRYLALVEDLLELPEDDRKFGVVAIRQGREVGTDGVSALYDVGCAAEVRRVEKQDDGRFLLVTIGGPRFRLGSLDASRPYLQGEVEWIDELAGDDAAGQVGAVQRAFTDYLAALGAVRETEIEVPELPDDPRLLSYLVAAATVTDHGEKQALLAAVTTGDRLRAELVLLRREQVLLTTLTAAPAPELTRYPQSPN